MNVISDHFSLKMDKANKKEDGVIMSVAKKQTAE